MFQDGCFLVRKSQRGGEFQPYTLVVLYKGHVYNLKIRKRSDTKVALGEEKPDELVSPSTTKTQDMLWALKLLANLKIFFDELKGN